MVRAGEGGVLRLGPALAERALRLALVHEDGQRTLFDVAAGAGVVEPVATPDGRTLPTRRIAVPPLPAGRYRLLVDDAELERRRAALRQVDGYAYPESQTPWQEIQRALVGQFDQGAVLEPAVKYQRIAQTRGLPRDSH